jgi:sulfoxide reductase heme-binding subunit YedZ
MHALKIAVWIGGAIPFALATLEASDGTIPGQAQAIAHFGLWSLRFLLAALAATPLGALLKRPAVTALRRDLGLVALAFALAHVGLCLATSGFLRWPVEAMRERPDFYPGFAALALMLALAAWGRRLRRWVPLAAALVVLHFAMPTGLEVADPYLYGLVLITLLAWRAWRGVLASRRLRTPGETSS